MSPGLTEEIRRNNWQFLMHKLQHGEPHQAVANKFRNATRDELFRLLRSHDTSPVNDPGEIEFRSLVDLWLGETSLLYLGWLCGYIPDPVAAPEGAMLHEILANPALRAYCEDHYPVAIPWLFRLHLEGRINLPSESEIAGAGAFERFSILYERFRGDEDLDLFLNLLDGFSYGRTTVETVVSSFQNPDRVAEALARPADRITSLDRGIVGMVRFLTFCHDLDQFLVLCAGMPRVQSAFWFFYGYWFHEYSVDVEEKSMEAIDKVMNAADSSGTDSTLEREKWKELLKRLNNGEYAKRLVAEMEEVSGKGDGDVSAWLQQFRPYAQPPEKGSAYVAGPDEEVSAPDADKIIQCRTAIRRLYTAKMFGEKLAPAIHQGYLDDLAEHPRDALYNRPYEQLDEAGKAANLAAAMRIPEILRLVGFELQVGESIPDQARAIAERIERNIEILAEAEHEGWMEEKRLAGWSSSPERDDAARKSPLLVPYAALSEFEKDKDRRTIRRYPAYAKLAGLKIVSKSDAT